MEATEDLIRTIIEKESWEEVIYYIVNVEKLDPWNIDLIKLCNSFIHFVRTAKELDFRIPAKIVFVAALLLRIKVDYLSILEEEKEEEKEIRPIETLDIDPTLLKLAYPIKRLPKRQITLDELIAALKKTMGIEKRREERASYARAQLEAQINWEEDIEKKIQKVLKEIEEDIKKSKLGKITFKQLVEEWKRDRIIDKFIPVLHLEKDRKVKTEQEEFFKEIWISK